MLSWKESFNTRSQYATTDRDPFYIIAGNYLPEDKSSVVVDIGCGDGDFAELLKLNEEYINLYLLESNSITINKLRLVYRNVINYTAPDRIPLPDNSVEYIHCSHMIEHLNSDDVYKFLIETDRILKTGGIFIISAPLFWRNFYVDLSHVRPYYPETFMRYLSFNGSNYSAKNISTRYVKKELVYRYDAYIPFDDGFGSEYSVIDFIIKLSKKVLNILKIKYYSRNGFTLVMQKTN